MTPPEKREENLKPDEAPSAPPKKHPVKTVEPERPLPDPMRGPLGPMPLPGGRSPFAGGGGAGLRTE